MEYLRIFIINFFVTYGILSLILNIIKKRKENKYIEKNIKLINEIIEKNIEITNYKLKIYNLTKNREIFLNNKDIINIEK